MQVFNLIFVNNVKEQKETRESSKFRKSEKELERFLPKDLSRNIELVWFA